MKMEPDNAKLRNAEVFRGLSDACLRALIDTAVRQRVAKGAVLFKQGDEPSRLCAVGNGRFKMTTVTPEGVQLLLQFMEPGDLMGCAAVFRRFPFPATATAAVDSLALCWSASEFKGLMEQYPQLASNALAIVGGQTQRMLQRLSEVTASSAEQRIAQALLRLAPVQAQSPDGQGTTAVRLSRQELGEMSAATLYTVSRTISRWARAHIVDSARTSILVRDRERLVRIAHGER